VPASIVLALSLGKVMTAMLLAFESGKSDWLHQLWSVVMVLLALALWVALWRLHANETWSAAEFFVVMVGPILFYAASHALASGQPESVKSWALHMEKIARPFLILLLLTIANFPLRNYVVLDAPLLNIPPTFFLIAAVTIAVVIYPKRWLVAVSAVCWLGPVLGTLVNTDLI